MTMNVFIALGVVVWVIFLLLSVGLAQAAAHSDLVVRRADYRALP